MPFLQSIQSFFGGGDSARNSKAYPARASSEAFSLPTTHVGYGESSEAGPSRPTPMLTTTYPPPAQSANFAASAYPPLTNTFHRLRNVLAGPFPEMLDTLNYPADPGLITEFEHELGCPLPPAVRESLLAVDGQDLDSGLDGGIFYGLYLLPLEDIITEWRFWRQIESDPTTGANPAMLATMASVPPTWIKSVYACRGWIPLLSDRTGNYVGVDLDPGPGGAWGQVIVFGHDFDRKCVLWRGEGEGGWGKWLASFVDELESGEAWADKSATSDDEEEIGYSSYSGAQTYGDLGKALRLVGDYKGWNVLEAWWDKSVRQWETMGLGMDVQEVERGLNEARRLAGLTGEPNTSVAGDIRAQQQTADEQIPEAVVPPVRQATPQPEDEDDHENHLLPPSSPPEPTNIPSILHPQSSPVRVITPLASTADHPLARGNTPKAGDLLHPPPRTAGRQKQKRPPAPAPSQLDLPTRADVQAAQAVAHAEATGLRGGWIMNIDTSVGAARRRTHTISPSLDAEMVDIDLEGGRGEAFGTPPMSAIDEQQQAEEDRLSMAGIEHRRESDTRSPVLLAMTRTPSPLSRGGSFEAPPRTGSPAQQQAPATQRSSSRGGAPSSTPPVSFNAGAGDAIRMPPRARRGSLRDRDSSLLSQDSHDNLLDGGPGAGTPTRRASDAFSPRIISGAPLSRSPPPGNTNGPVGHEAYGEEGDLADGLREVKL